MPERMTEAVSDAHVSDSGPPIHDERGASVHSTDQRPLLVASNWSKRFGGRAVLQDVAFEVRQGEILGLVGQNGSGKSLVQGPLAEAKDAGILVIANNTANENAELVTDVDAQ